MYWWPSFYNPQILESINNKVGQGKFIKAAKIVFSFPREFELHDSDSLMSIIKKLPKDDEDVKNIKRYLKDKDPSKYFNLK